MAGVLIAVAAWVTLGAQGQMPSAREMSGIPLAAPELPDGTISVRVVRGQLSNNVPNHPVELHFGGQLRSTSRTDDSGRAQFTGVAPGTRVHIITTVDGKRLESQELPVPEKGGARIMLVGSGGATTPAPAQQAGPPVAGTVVLGSDSRFVFDVSDDGLQVYYLLEIMNKTQAPVAAEPLVFEMPSGAQGTTVLEGSTTQAEANGPRVAVKGPFSPGRTPLQVAYHLPYSRGAATISQALPAALEQVSVAARKIGEVHLGSPQITNHQDVVLEGQTYIMATGPGVAKNTVLTFNLSGLPHHSLVPRTIAVVLAVAILVAGAWAAATPEADGRARRRQLQARQEKLLADLVRIERQHLAGSIEPPRYAGRRRELIAQLERIYGELDGGLAA